MNFKKLEEKFGQADNEQKKIDVLKDNYPAFYLTFCKDCNLADKE